MFIILFLTLTLVPAACARFLKPRDERATLFDRLAGGYRGLVLQTLRRRGLVLLATLALTVIAVVFGAELGTELFPQVDAGQFTVLARAPTGTRIEETERIMIEVENELERVIGRSDPGNADPESAMQILYPLGSVGCGKTTQISGRRDGRTPHARFPSSREQQRPRASKSS